MTAASLWYFITADLLRNPQAQLYLSCFCGSRVMLQIVSKWQFFIKWPVSRTVMRFIYWYVNLILFWERWSGLGYGSQNSLFKPKFKKTYTGDFFFLIPSVIGTVRYRILLLTSHQVVLMELWKCLPWECMILKGKVCVHKTC